jgi:uncharacterized small protein (DUF1192 family)
MAVSEEDDRRKKKLAHEIGQDLALLSVEELRERIALLNDEIARLEAAMAKKRASRATADCWSRPLGLAGTATAELEAER